LRWAHIRPAQVKRYASVRCWWFLSQFVSDDITLLFVKCLFSMTYYTLTIVERMPILVSDLLLVPRGNAWHRYICSYVLSLFDVRLSPSASCRPLTHVFCLVIGSLHFWRLKILSHKDTHFRLLVVDIASTSVQRPRIPRSGCVEYGNRRRLTAITCSLTAQA
jgi:hypothetical protein